MPKPPSSNSDHSVVRDRQGRRWTISVVDIEKNDELDSWIHLSPEQRIDLIGECVLDGLRVKGQSDIPRLRRIYRIIERAPSSVPDRRRVRSRVSRST